MKKERLDRFIYKLVDDQILRKKFRESRKRPEAKIPLESQVLGNLNQDSDLYNIERMFTPYVIEGKVHDSEMVEQ